jgi:hypothetical protein
MTRVWFAGIVILAVTAPAAAHGIVGSRMFIEPITTEDANVKNELVFPSIDFLKAADGTVRTTGVSLEKSIYPDRVSVILETGRIARTGAQGSGWDNRCLTARKPSALAYNDHRTHAGRAGHPRRRAQMSGVLGRLFGRIGGSDTVVGYITRRMILPGAPSDEVCTFRASHRTPSELRDAGP